MSAWIWGSFQILGGAAKARVWRCLVEAPRSPTPGLCVAPSGADHLAAPAGLKAL